MNIGQIIKKARKSKELTQKNLGAIIGVNKMQVYAWEKNKDIPGAKNLLLLIKHLNITLDDFFKEEVCIHANTIPSPDDPKDK